MNIEMKYHNVYYYCGILNNVIEYQQEEFLTKLWEFSHVYLEKVPEKYDKESVLLLFCRWAVKSIMEEDMEEELAELKQLIEESADKNEKALEKVFWNNGVYFSFEVERAIEHYYGKSNHFCERKVTMSSTVHLQKDPRSKSCCKTAPRTISSRRANSSPSASTTS